ncbi:hypothetical protein CAPTEDRAFT_225189 [Capitella teleta]|uniref:Arrestin C-terminal-like domain-containing protein n=1 Tax=Capitella teleta TaxID=283909 RepID=R7VD95_CAPTE|nr:hypothetical protein CAPTEDRAFT_225189 [Capitella teleta]|eukprot:ELU16803.1 hypothetical protein CAPTEDRAFT_225189 [Capitella teleta]
MFQDQVAIMGREFQIKYENENAVFHSGDVVSGSVTLETTEVTSLERLTVRLSGKGYAEWRQTGQYVQLLPACKKSATYLYKVFHLWVGETLQPGTHTIPFQHRLPEDLPSSFQGYWGYVRYKSTAMLVRKGSSRYYAKTSEYFSVIRNLDLNLHDPQLRVPVEHSRTKRVQTYFCRSAGDIQAKFRINKTGFVPGEHIQVHVDVKNNSSLSARVKIRLEELSTYDVTDVNSKLIQTCRQMPIKKSGPILSGEHFEWDDATIKVPTTPPTGLEGCDFINVKHTILFKVSMKGSGSSPILFEQDLVIGTVPLRDATDIINSALPSYEEASMLPSNSPPSYEDSQLEDLNCSFHPLYPVYDFPPGGPAPVQPTLPPPAYEEQEPDGGACGSDDIQVTHF